MADDTYAPLVADRAPLNSVKWAARDYASIFDDLLRRLKLLYQEVYNDYATTTQGIMLIEMMAYATAQIQWYMDRIASDCFLDTARTHTAVNRIVKQLGYKMRPASTASTELTLTFPNGTPGPFVMPARWRFQGPNGLVYESYAALSEPAALPAGTTRTIMVRQGDTRLLTFTADGSANQVYNLSGIPDGRYLADLSVEGWVDGMEWEERPFLSYDADAQFEVDYLEAPPKVRFGDGVAGAIPPQGAEVKFRFVLIDGKKGNEPKAHSINASIDTLIVGGTLVEMTVDNPVAPTGGADPETVEHAKNLAPLSFAARGAAITAQDYDALSNSFVDPLYGAVAKAYAFNPRGTYADIVFDGYAWDIDVELDGYVASASVLETDIVAAAAAIDPAAAIIDQQIADLETVRGDAETYALTAKSQMAGALSSCATVEASVQTINSLSAIQTAALADLETYVNDNLPAGAVRTHIFEEVFNATERSQTIEQKAQLAIGEAQTAQNAISSASSASINPLIDLLTTAAPVAPDLSIPQIITLLTDAHADIAATTPVLVAKATDMVGQAAAMAVAVKAVVVSMQTRIGALFSDDCLSNYVQVPVLAQDADGNYTAPSAGLIAGLQAYLDGVKEVTQQVEVIDGSPILVPATLDVKLNVISSYVYAEEEAKVRAAIIALLKGRDFNQPLYLSQLYRTVREASVGVAYVNITIASPVIYKDVDGNLVPPENRIITLGSLTITKID